MSMIFYDKLIILNGLDKKLKKMVTSNDELQELWTAIEEIMHHRVMGCVLDKLPQHHHEEFLNKFQSSPHDEKLLGYLKEKIDGDIEDIIKKEVKLLHKEILSELKTKKK